MSRDLSRYDAMAWLDAVGQGTKYWVGILAVSKACLAYSGDMRQGNRNALLKLGMWRL